jgi:oligosaccharyltransferase complex subunit alpha (ribophorin I)
VEPGAGEAFTQDTPVTKSGATLTYGPFSNLPPSDGADFVKTHQRSVPVQYGYEFPVLEVTKFRRYAEVSHWGANLNIHDEMNLRNAGPTYVFLFSSNLSVS